MSDGRSIRWATAAVVVAVAVFAAIVSYTHIFELGRAHGQFGTAGRLLPLSVDGLILAASLVMLHEARQGRGAPRLARCMLILGVAATVGANVAYGAVYGPLGALISAWPAVAFIGSAEMLIALIRGPKAADGGQVPGPEWSAAPGSAEEAAAMAYTASVRGGNPLSQRALTERFGVTRTQARQVMTGVAVSANGNGAH